MITVIIPTALRRFTDGTSSIDVDGENVFDVLQQLTEQFPELRNHLLDDHDQIQSFINVFVNNENIRDRDDHATTLADGDELFLVPAMAGG